MACVLSNLQSQCQQFGAIVRVYVASTAQIDGVLFGTNDLIDTLDLTAGEEFVVLTPESLDATTQTLNVLTRDDRSAPARWSHTVDTVFLGTSNSMRAAIAALVDCCDKLFAVVETANGDRFWPRAAGQRMEIDGCFRCIPVVTRPSQRPVWGVNCRWVWVRSLTCEAHPHSPPTIGTFFRVRLSRAHGCRSNECRPWCAPALLRSHPQGARSR